MMKKKNEYYIAKSVDGIVYYVDDTTYQHILSHQEFAQLTNPLELFLTAVISPDHTEPHTHIKKIKDDFEEDPEPELVPQQRHYKICDDMYEGITFTAVCVVTQANTREISTDKGNPNFVVRTAFPFPKEEVYDKIDKRKNEEDDE